MSRGAGAVVGVAVVLCEVERRATCELGVWRAAVAVVAGKTAIRMTMNATIAARVGDEGRRTPARGESAPQLGMGRSQEHPGVSAGDGGGIAVVVPNLLLRRHLDQSRITALILVLTVAVAGVVVGDTVGGSDAASWRATELARYLVGVLLPWREGVQRQGCASGEVGKWPVTRWVALLVPAPFEDGSHAGRDNAANADGGHQECGGVGVGAAAVASLPVVGLDRIDAGGREDAHEEDHKSRSEMAGGTVGGGLPACAGAGEGLCHAVEV
ncbi:hypothetical protein CYMTET_49279 [Cymbomonas tetramitiformis]|uniref:Uncharacterized protein n=1 Tax=Cymbomonas tetramitiformis TaxID=36881 RepID=A0AAE0BRR2_9CHLO|nr:hypothetical protein CYMTET_49279 [Cymbomonas tetramitiformis]